MISNRYKTRRCPHKRRLGYDPGGKYRKAYDKAWTLWRNSYQSVISWSDLLRIFAVGYSNGYDQGLEAIKESLVLLSRFSKECGKHRAAIEIQGIKAGP